MDAKVTWKSGFSFDGFGGSSGFSLPMDTSVESGGENSGLRPMELMLIGLGGCTGMDVVSILLKKRQKLTGFEVRIHGERAATDPKVFTDIVVEFIITGKEIDPKAVDRAIELSENKYCSVQGMLGKTANITHTIKIVES